MEQLSSGDNNLEIWDAQQGWIHIGEAYLKEASEYKLRYVGEMVCVFIQGVPLPFYREEGLFYATMLTPLQSGALKITINNQEMETFIYPDDRKLTEEQYNLMIEDILEEANVCFQLSGLEIKVNSYGKNRNISWSQWSYIERSFQLLRQIFSKIEYQPIRRLEKQPNISKREMVRTADRFTLKWLDKKGYGTEIPANVETMKTYETCNVYENQVLKQQVLDLYRLLRMYQRTDIDAVSLKAKRYKLILQHWINSPFLTQITENKGEYRITQTFRKHPVYRLWYRWFESLFNHNRESIGLSYPIALKDTFFLYEMWCYMKIVKTLREAGFVGSTDGLFRTTKEGLFLHLAENNESSVGLHGGLTLYFQRTYQYNSNVFHTYTQRMIPDIVIEGRKGIIVFDPKYRVPGNLGTALGEMHKYRDGIISRETRERAVREVYILTPTTSGQADHLRYFEYEYQIKYQMGAFKMLPGVINEEIKRKLIDCVKQLRSE